MPSERAALLALFSFFLFSLFVLHHKSQNQRDRLLLSNSDSPLGPYQFEDPTLAYHLLSQLDIYEPIEGTIPPKNGSPIYEHAYVFYGLKTDEEYCNRHRAYFVSNPEFIFKEKNFVSSMMRNSDLKRHWLRLIGGSDIMPHVHSRVLGTFNNKEMLDVRPDINIFMFHNQFMRKINKEFACTTQYFNHIPGQVLSRKDLVAQAIYEYKEKYESQPQCLDTHKYFPKTWVMRNKAQCQDFFREFNSSRYEQLKKERGTVYFRKLGTDTHQGMGVFPVDAKEEHYLKYVYREGRFCGNVGLDNLVQEAIHNPLLLNGRKADFRFYIFIASTNPLIVFYNDGYFSVSLNQFDPNSTSKNTVLTNWRLTRELFKEDERFDEMSFREMEEDTIWTFERLQDYLLKKGLITDDNWLDNYFRPELMKMTLHLIRLANDSLTRRTSIYEIYGVDAVMDQEFGLWFIEANANPALENFPPGSDHVIKNMISDAFEVVFGLLRSRTKRIIDYINRLARDSTVWEVEGQSVRVIDYKKRREEFLQITKNYFEPEFEAKVKGKMIKVLDENYSGKERYGNLLPAECF